MHVLSSCSEPHCVSILPMFMITSAAVVVKEDFHLLEAPGFLISHTCSSFLLWILNTPFRYLHVHKRVRHHLLQTDTLMEQSNQSLRNAGVLFNMHKSWLLQTRYSLHRSTSGFVYPKYNQFHNWLFSHLRYLAVEVPDHSGRFIWHILVILRTM